MRKKLHFYSYDSLKNPWLGGGGSVRDLEMLSRYHSAFESIDLYVGSWPGAQIEVVNGIHIIPLGGGSSEWMSRIRYWHAAQNQLKKPQSDVIVGVNLSPYAPLKNAFLKGHNSFGILHHCIGDKWLGKVPLGLGHFVKNFEYSYYKKSQNTVILNPETQALMKALNPDVNLFQSGNSFDESLLQLVDQTDYENPFILYFGRMDPYMKGIDLLIGAFEKADLGSMRLVLAGRGDAESQAQVEKLKQNSTHTHLIDLIFSPTDEQRAQLLSRCLFFASPSRYEGWGIAAVEANAAGKPVLVSQAAGFKSSIADQVSGIRVDLDVPEALVDGLKKMSFDVDFREKLKQGSRLWAEQFTWNQLAAQELQWILKIG
jgi:glycosyltransferase involved in cell wall biosynthesis